MQDGLETICRNVQLEAHFIDDLLDITRITARQARTDAREPVDLHDAVRRAVEICEADISAKAQRLTIDLSAQSHQVTGDFPRLQQVFWNLLKNASKFTPERGDIHLASRDAHDSVIVEVTDNGRGIEVEALPHIFDAISARRTTR